jgi:hypothetical protein
LSLPIREIGKPRFEPGETLARGPRILSAAPPHREQTA